MLLLPDVTARAKYCQMTSPESTNTGYGIPADGIAASLPKTNVKTTVLSSGLSTAQPIPKSACFYCTPIWRHANTNNSSSASTSSVSHREPGLTPGRRGDDPRHAACRRYWHPRCVRWRGIRGTDAMRGFRFDMRPERAPVSLQI
jgi:hypothetical protein